MHSNGRILRFRAPSCRWSADLGAGLHARWQVLELNRSYRQAWSEGEVDEAMLDESAFGVGLYQTVDVYQRGERAIKYALLFIALTFLTFFAWEQVTARLGCIRCSTCWSASRSVRSICC